MTGPKDKMAISDEAREEIVDTIEEIISETHDLDVRDIDYAENIVSWMERHHPAALRALAADTDPQPAPTLYTQDQVDAAVKAEREACADMLRNHAFTLEQWRKYSCDIRAAMEAAIRARGEQA